MALSSVSGSTFPQAQLANSKNIAEQGSENSRSNPRAKDNVSTQIVDDSVSLSKPERSSAVEQVVDQGGAEKLLSQTMNSILADSSKAVSAQAGISASVAVSLLAD